MPTVPLPFSTPDGAGGSYTTVVASSTRRLYYALDPGTDGRWHFEGLVPDDYGSAPSIIAVVYANATTGIHRLNIEIAVSKDAEDGDPTLTALTAQGITVPGTAYLEDRVTWSSGIPTLEAGDSIYGCIHRDADGTGGTDSLAVPTLCRAILLSYTAA